MKRLLLSVVVACAACGTHGDCHHFDAMTLTVDGTDVAPLNLLLPADCKENSGTGLSLTASRVQVGSMLVGAEQEMVIGLSLTPGSTMQLDNDSFQYREYPEANGPRPPSLQLDRSNAVVTGTVRGDAVGMGPGDAIEGSYDVTLTGSKVVHVRGQFSHVVGFPLR